MKRDFNKWLSTFKTSISGYSYYCDFEKIKNNVNLIKVELNILNSLIGEKDIERKFQDIVTKYPETLKCIPILMAVRSAEIEIFDGGKSLIYGFEHMNYSIEQYSVFMRETGLFSLLSNHLIANLFDYATGVETGLDSNGRKNRGGKLMESLVKFYLDKLGFTVYEQMSIREIESKWGINLGVISNQGTTQKRFDFVVKTDNCIYLFETNFYQSSGTKLNETARSYKMITEEMSGVTDAKFVWITDGGGWFSAKNNLRETFDVLDNLYNISELENGVLKDVII